LEQHNDLAPGAEEELCDAIRDAYDLAQLKRLLYWRCDGIRIEDIATGMNFENTVFEVFLAAKEGGWLTEKLIPQVLAGKPGNSRLREWARKYRSPQQPAGPAAQAAEGASPAWQLMDSAYFDLAEIRSLIREAMAMHSGQVIGFWITYPESTFVRKLSGWLQSHAGITESKDRLYLSPIVSSLDYRLRQVREYRQLLDTVNVLCEVVVDGVLSDGAITDFWTGVRQEFGGAKYRLILVFVGVRPSFPAGITVLPQPQFTRFDVEFWVENLLRQRGWPLDLATDWTAWLCERASVSGQLSALDVRMLYEAMDSSVKDFRMVPLAEFRARLKKGRDHAIPSPG
jgi:hypothetical protein